MYTEGDTYKRDLRCLIKIVEEFRAFDAQMELSQLLVYLLITAAPGKKVADLLPATGLSRSALSRNILALSKGEYRADHRANPKPGLDLITTVTDPFDGRAQLAAPTRRGVGLAEKISRYFHTETNDNGKEARQ
jgi:DNA-binding MarR family transcriptional regulator